MKEPVFTPHAPSPIGPFSQGILAKGTTLYISGNIGINQDGILVDGGVKAQTRQAFTNIQAILSEAGYTFSDVVKVNVYLITMKDFAAMNEVYSEFFRKPEPARTTVQVAGLPKDAIVEIELIAVK